jgi:DNA-binding transcriptional ArsR family regulator
MTIAKLELFDQELQDAASFFKALSHPARLAILNYLAESKMCITGDISKELPLSRTTVNQHLDELKRAGLIIGEISGAKTKYCLNNEKLKELNTRFSKFILNLKCC